MSADSDKNFLGDRLGCTRMELLVIATLHD